MDVPEITVDEADERRQQGAPVLDVREPDEYENGHVPGAVHIPLGDVPEAELPGVLRAMDERMVREATP